MQSENINELATALAKAQNEITFAPKESLNPHYKSKYADLASVWDACRGPLSKNNLSVTQTMDTVNGQLMLFTTLLHSSGQWIRSVYPIITQRQDPQAYGAAVTYARRYCLAAICGIAQDDSDAEEAMERTAEKEKAIKKITGEQAQEIEQILSECDPHYQKIVWMSLKKNNIHKLEEMPADLYARLLTAATTNRESYQSQELQETQETIEE